MVRLEDLTLLDTGKPALLRDEDGNEFRGHIVADPIWVGKIAFQPEDYDQVINIYVTDELEFV